MFWIFLLLVGIFLIVYFGKRGNEDLAVIGVTATVVTGVLLAILLPKGIGTYPSLVGQLYEIKALQQRIDDIRGAVYPEQSGKLIGGSLANLQQSSKLSDYLCRIAVAEASYNSSLVKAHLYKRDFIYIVFGYGFFISDKVFQLPEIKG